MRIAAGDGLSAITDLVGGLMQATAPFLEPNVEIHRYPQL